jgi:MerR family transcriptional regulator, light-induced transcriptional regulator
MRASHRGAGPRALQACVPGEAHDISLIAFGLVLRSHGWRIVFLGADTPLSTLAQTAQATQPQLTVLSIFEPTLLGQHASALRRLAKALPLALSGPGASDALCKRLRIRRLDGDLVTAAHAVADERHDR